MIGRAAQLSQGLTCTNRPVTPLRQIANNLIQEAVGFLAWYLTIHGGALVSCFPFAVADIESDSRVALKCPTHTHYAHYSTDDTINSNNKALGCRAASTRGRLGLEGTADDRRSR